ncbi:MAG: DUF4340 domain-containing protein [Acidobacteriota bacterium]|nr:DUF4340 domain-containing protein [Acidobacteriota bacterium]
MKLHGLLIAAVVLAILGGGVYWSEHRKPTADTSVAADTPPKILSIPEDQFKEIRLAKKGADPTVIAKIANRWEIVQPKPMPADQDAVSSIVTALASLNADRLIEDKPSGLESFGLTAPSEEIDITKKDGKVNKLLLGADSPVGSGVYAKLEGDPRVFTIPTYSKSSLDKTSKDLRDKRLLTFNSDKLTRVDLQNGQSKRGTIEFGKNNQNEWQILKPKPLRADGMQVDELVRKLKDAKMDLSAPEADLQKVDKAFASGAKVGSATLTDSSGSQTLDVRKGKDKNYYAKSSVVEGAYKIPNDLGEALDKGVDDFRNKKLFDFGFSDPSKVQIGGTVYQKSGEKWMVGTAQKDAPSVQNLIDKLRDLTAIKFVDQGGGTDVFDATVTSNEGKRTERVVISKQGNSYFGRREGEPGVYELDGKAVEELQKAAAAIKPFQKPK